MNNPRLIIDIETGADYLAVSEFIPRFPAFDPASVAVGNIKDPEKIKLKVDLAEQKHARDAQQHVDDFRDRAALDAWTGEVVAVGLKLPSGEDRIIGGDEGEILENTWAYLGTWMEKFHDIVGFNIKGFDLPFLVRRSWKNKVPVPVNLLSKDRYFHPSFVDLRDKWAVGEYRPKGSLDLICRHFGLKGKAEDFGGADFAEAYRSGDEERIKRAREYLREDLRMTAEVADIVIGPVTKITKEDNIFA
jgi:hypothetical protein